VHKKKESQTQNGELIAHTLFCRQYTFCRFLIFLYFAFRVEDASQCTL
jgi:hypothetical protein